MDPATLRRTLMQTRIDQVSIQKSAAGLMSHYGGVPSVAVNEWRQALGMCQVDQLLPLLYVANEVLQTSKRNRGTQFLEAFSGVLGKALQLICQRLTSESADGISKVEKARRVVKIWGDRSVFSVRFATEILAGVEQYRKPVQPVEVAAPVTKRVSSPKSNRRSIGKSINKTDIFGSPAGESLLQVDVGNFVKDAAPPQSPTLKRKRSNDAISANSPKRNSSSIKNKKSTTMSLVDILNELEDLNMQYRGLTLRMDGSLLSLDQETIETMVGDELEDSYRKVVQMENFLKSHALKQIHRIAQRRYELEQMLLSDIIPPLRHSVLKQDEEDSKWSKHLLNQLMLLKEVHAQAALARDAKRLIDKNQKVQEQMDRQQKLEDEAKKRALEEALKKPEQEEGMVWNPVTREFQAATDATQGESWRDH